MTVLVDFFQLLTCIECNVRITQHTYKQQLSIPVHRLRAQYSLWTGLCSLALMNTPLAAFLATICNLFPLDLVTGQWWWPTFVFIAAVPQIRDQRPVMYCASPTDHFIEFLQSLSLSCVGELICEQLSHLPKNQPIKEGLVIWELNTEPSRRCWLI